MAFKKSLKGMVIFSLFWTLSCEREITDVEPTNAMTVAKAVVKDNEVISNPYEITFMNQVLNEIKSLSNQYNENNNYTEGLDISNFSIEPNFKYIKFNPENVEQEALLRADESLPLVDYPLDFQSADHYYMVSNIEPPAENEIPSYYTSVSLSKQLPDVPYIELQQMYLPDEDSYFEAVEDEETPTIEGKISNKFDLINHMYTLAYQQSENGNLLPPDVIETSENDVQTKFLGISFRGKWTPSGHLEIFDENVTRTTTSTVREIIGYETVACNNNGGFNEVISYELEDDVPTGSGSSNPSGLQLEIISDARVCRVPIYRTLVVTGTSNYIPLVGAQVLVRDTFTLGNAITNANGDFTHNRVRPAVRYIIQWERSYYSIRDNGWQAEMHGPKLRERSWFRQFRGGEDAYHANIHRGAHMYYYENLPNLSYPATSLELGSQMSIAAVESSVNSNHVPFRRNLFAASVIRLKKWNAVTSDIVGTTIHELAHSVHWKIDKTSYNNIVWDAYIDPTLSGGLGPTANNNRRLLESWAMHIEVFYMNEFYNRLGEPNVNYLDRVQSRVIFEDIHYTSGIFDLTDDFNQRIVNNNVNLPDDPAEGYTPRQLQDALHGARSWNQYRDKIKSLNIDNPNDVDVLFANW